VKNLLLTLTCLVLAAQTHASERYRVEVMIFAYLDENSAREEHWPLLEQWKQEEAATIEAQLLMANEPEEEVILDLNSTTELPTEEESTTPEIVPLDTLIFADAATRFRYRSDIAMLWHQAWIEEIQDIDNPIIHEINTEIEKDIQVKLSGTIQLHRSRFIHITPDLTVEQFIFAIPDDIENISPENMAPDNTAPEDTLLMPEVDQALQFNQTPVAQWIPLRAAKVNLSRRMRSDEVHYIDHPLLGMVVKISPYAAPKAAVTKQNLSENTGSN
jgi:hypothetical protein